MTTADYSAALAHVAPGIPVAFTIDEDGTFTIEKWGGEGEPPTIAELETWAADASAAAARCGNNETAIRARLLDGLATADTHLAALEGATPTAAQLRAATIFALRAIKALTRLELDELEQSD